MEYRKGSHSVFDLKYHFIFCPKYRYRVMVGEVAERARCLIREVCRENEVMIISGHVRLDHIHLFLSIPPRVSISRLVQYIKGKSSRKLFQEFAHLKKRYWGQHLWARGYFIVSIGNLNEKQVVEYIENQDMEHGDDRFEISGGVESFQAL